MVSELHKKSIIQTGISLLCVSVIALICYLFKAKTDYKISALILMFATSIIAVAFKGLPVLIASIFSVILLIFFFINPIHSFSIANTDDFPLVASFLLIALVNLSLNIKINKFERKARDKEEKEKTILLYDTLLNSLSHELKTPLATIIGSVDTLKENRAKLTDSTKDILLNEIEKATNRLNNQVENLLNISRIESGFIQPKKDWIDVDELINSVLNRINDTNPNQQFIYTENENLPLYKIDGGLIEQVIYNITSNAILYTPENSLVKIETKSETDALMIKIEDNGKGIPEEFLSHIFEKFTRAQHSKSGGTGLGLSIAKGFVEAHSGKIEVENINGSGARFKIIIPAESSYLKNLKNE